MTQIPNFLICQRVISCRWKLPILEQLAEVRRFGELQENLPDISRSVLAAQLQDLLQMELIQQIKYVCFPPCVEYRLTEKGWELLNILEAEVPQM